MIYAKQNGTYIFGTRKAENSLHRIENGTSNSDHGPGVFYIDCVILYFTQCKRKEECMLHNVHHLQVPHTLKYVSAKFTTFVSCCRALNVRTACVRTAGSWEVQ